MVRSLQYAFIAIVTISVGFSLYQWNASRAAVKLQQSTSVNLTNGLVGYWTFDGDDVSGTTAYDRSGSANNGTLTNGPTKAAGKLGQALNFDGVDDNVLMSSDAIGSGATSICAWVYPRSSGDNGFGRIVVSATGGGTESTLLLMQSGPRIGLSSNGGGTSLNTVNIITYNNWIHVCATRDASGSGVIYRNGVLDNSGTTGTPSSGATKVYIGDRGTPDRSFDGLIDDVRIYNRQISAGEIQSLYDLGNPDKVNTSQGDPLEQGLVGYWKLDDASGTTATDSSGNANAGTLTNGPTWGTGRINGDVVFDGVDDYVDAGTSSSVRPSFPFSVSVWANPVSLSATNMLVSTADIANNGIYSGYSIMINTDGSITGQVGNNSLCNIGNRKTFTTSAGVVTTGTWHYVTVVFTNINSFSIYVNGRAVSSSSSGNAVSMAYAAGARLRMGVYYDTCSTTTRYSPNSQIDEVRIYNRALSDEEVTKLYRTTTPDNPDTGLVGYWPMNGKDINGTTAYDRSGKGNTGTLTNGPTRTAGRIGQALSFDGVDDYIDVVNTSFSGTFTFSTWFYTSNNAQTGIIFGEQTADGGPKPKIGMNGGNFFVRIDSVGLSVDNSVAIPVANQWHHFVLSRDGSNKVDLYVDGVRTRLFGDVAQPNTYILDKLSSNGNPSQWFNGRLDEPRIYSRALSATEITALYNSGR